MLCPSIGNVVATPLGRLIDIWTAFPTVGLASTKHKQTDDAGRFGIPDFTSGVGACPGILKYLLSPVHRRSKNRLIHTVCACAAPLENSETTVYVRKRKKKSVKCAYGGKK